MTAGPERLLDRPRGLAAGGVAGSLALGLLYPVTAYFGHPAALPLILVAVAVVVMTIRRLEVGVAVAFVLLALNTGLPAAGRWFPATPPWLPATAWIGFLFVLAMVRRPAGDGRTGLAPLSGVVGLYLAVLLGGMAISTESGAFLPVMRSAATGVMFFYVVATQVRDRRQVELALGGLVAGAFLIGGYGAWQSLSGVSSGIGFLTSTGQLIGRATANFGHPNQLAGFLVLLVPLAIAGAITARRGRPLHIAATALSVLAVYASFSRGALMGLAVVPLFFLRGRGVLLIVPIAGAALLVAGPQLVEERFATVTQGGPELAGRMDFWRTAGAIWAEHPVVGAGPGSFPTAYAQVRAPGKQFLPDTTLEPPPHAHNLPLHLLAEQGLVGLIAFAAVFAAAVHRSLALRRSPERWVAILGTAMVATLVAFFVHNLFDVTLLERTGSYFWGVLGLLSALSVIHGLAPAEPAGDDTMAAAAA